LSKDCSSFNAMGKKRTALRQAQGERVRVVKGRAAWTRN
jgi:hypothetical protein